MSMDFSGSAGAASSFDMIPAGQLAFAILSVRGVKASDSGGGYLDCELVIDAGQPYAGRKVWDMIGDPNNGGNSEAYRRMGSIAITRILETGRGAGPNNAAGYAINSYDDLSGLRVAVKLGVKAGTNGHADKNRVTEYLTPNPASQSGHKGYASLQAGVFNTIAPANAVVSGFGAAAGAPGATFAGFGGQVAAAPAPGFGTPAAGGFAPTVGATPSDPAASPSSTGFATTASSPSNPAATPGWLAQAAQ